MPGGNGFELLEKLEDVPAVIFTTAYDEYAVRAFEVNALDYLVKPITADRLAAALGRAQRALAAFPKSLPTHGEHPLIIRFSCATANAAGSCG
jgi:two-component system LytT family response regulator